MKFSPRFEEVYRRFIQNPFKIYSISILNLFLIHSKFILDLSCFFSTILSSFLQSIYTTFYVLNIPFSLFIYSLLVIYIISPYISSQSFFIFSTHNTSLSLYILSLISLYIFTTLFHLSFFTHTLDYTSFSFFKPSSL